MEFAFEAKIFREGKEVSSRKHVLTGIDLSFHAVEISRKGLLELVNRWNRNGLIGLSNGGPQYIYIALGN